MSSKKDDRQVLALPLFSDRPVEAGRYFNFSALADGIIGMLARRWNPTPFVFLVDGKWGSGKTTLMKTVMAGLEPAAGPDVVSRVPLEPDDPLVPLVEGSLMRWAPVRALESESGKRWSEVEPGEEGPPAGWGEMTDDQRDAWRRLRWVGDLVGVPRNHGSKPSATLDPDAFFKEFRPVRAVFFNAWKYRDETDIFPALAHEMLASMRRDGWLARFQAVVQEVGAADWREAVAKVAEIVPHVGGALGELVRPPEWLADVALYDRARPFLQGLATAWATTWGLTADSKPRRLLAMLRDDIRNVRRHLRGLRALSEPTEGMLPGIVAVFIDDLDRCPREHVWEVVKALNLLVDLDDCAFVLGADREKVAEALRRTGEAEGVPSAYGDQFLGKIVQLHLVLPEPEWRGMEEYVRSLLAEAAGVPAEAGESRWRNAPFPIPNLRRLVPLIVRGLPPNPRRVKEFLNQAVARLAWHRATEDGRRFPEERAVAIVKYLLVCLALPARLRSDRGFLARLDGLTAEREGDAEGRPLPEAIRRVLSSGPDMEDDGGPELTEAIAGLAEGDEDLADLVRWVARQDPKAWARVARVLAWRAREGGRVVRLAGHLSWLTKSAPPASAGAAEAEVERGLGEIRKEREQKERKRIEVLRDLRPLIEGVISELLADTGGGAAEAEPAQGDLFTESTIELVRRAFARYGDAVRGLRYGWSEDHPEAVRAALGAAVTRLGQLQHLAHRAQLLLGEALADRALGRQGAQLNLAVALRDGAVDRAEELEGADPAQVDPFQWEIWQEKEAELIEQQLEETEKTLRSSPFVERVLEKRPQATEGGFEELLKALLDDQGARAGRTDPKRWDVRRVGPTWGAFLPEAEEASWLLVPVGLFLMGDVASEDELPVRVERLGAPAWVARDPVTVGDYLDFIMPDFDTA